MDIFFHEIVNAQDKIYNIHFNDEFFRHILSINLLPTIKEETLNLTQSHKTDL